MPYNTTVLANRRRIPAYAGMTVGGRGIPDYAGFPITPDSRLRGNDGRGRGIPAYAGFPLTPDSRLRRIPAYAGMTVGGRRIPAYAGMTVGGAGFPLTRE